jgi:hypothetical protein
LLVFEDAVSVSDGQLATETATPDGFRVRLEYETHAMRGFL